MPMVTGDVPFSGNQTAVTDFNNNTAYVFWDKDRSPLNYTQSILYNVSAGSLWDGAENKVEIRTSVKLFFEDPCGNSEYSVLTATP